MAGNASGPRRFGVLYSWSRRISRASPTAVLRATLIAVAVAALVAIDVVVRNADNARSVNQTRGNKGIIVNSDIFCSYATRPWAGVRLSLRETY